LDATGTSSATATGAGSTAAINPYFPEQHVDTSTATATDGGTAIVQSNGPSPLLHITVTGDTANATGVGSIATVLDDETSSLTVNNGQSFEIYGQKGGTFVNESAGTPPGAAVSPAEGTPLTDAHLTPSILEPHVLPAIPLP
jgi:hypothetical protein